MGDLHMKKLLKPVKPIKNGKTLYLPVPKNFSKNDPNLLKNYKDTWFECFEENGVLIYKIWTTENNLEENESLDFEEHVDENEEESLEYLGLEKT
jgi:hypothetical protein